MFFNHIKTSLRNILKNRLFSFINILGLSISMSVCLLVISMTVDIKSYDHFHENKHSIYRVISTQKSADHSSTEKLASTTLALLPNLKQDFPQIENVAGIRLGFQDDMDSGIGIKPLTGIYAEPSFLNIFSFKMINGDETKALSEPFTIVLTESAANKLFGDTNPVGELLSTEGGENYLVTGLMENPPSNSHIDFESLVSMATFEAIENQSKGVKRMSNWRAMYDNYIYVEMNDASAVSSVNSALAQIGKDFAASNQSIEMSYSLQPLLDIITGEQLGNQIGLTLPAAAMIVFGVLAFLIILTATFNYTNLSLARASSRAKEVGVRKVMGAKRRQVVAQFITEAVVIAIFSLIVSVFLFMTVRDMFLNLAPEIEELVSLKLSLKLVIIFFLFALLTGLLAGLFPSLVLSKISAQNALKDPKGVKLLKHLSLRKLLLVLQFTFSLLFINGTYLYVKQYRFAQNFDLGFDSEHIYNLNLQGNDAAVVRSEFSKINGIESIAYSDFIPNTGTTSTTYTKFKDPSDSAEIFTLTISPEYIVIHGFELLAGANFESRMDSEIEQAIIVNEKFLQRFGMGEASAAVGELVKVDGQDMVIKGVVKDFYFNGFDKAIEPFFFRPSARGNWASIKIRSTDILATISVFEKTWQEIDPRRSMEGEFYEERIRQSFAQFSIPYKIIGFLSVLTISIAALGLMGMVVFIAETRAKEVGIRKVLGASEKQLAYLLSRGFIVLLLVASFISLPLTYFVFDQMLLASFANRISIGAMDLSVGFLIMLSMMLLTIGSQVIKASYSNPVNSLRSE